MLQTITTVSDTMQQIHEQKNPHKTSVWQAGTAASYFDRVINSQIFSLWVVKAEKSIWYSCWTNLLT